VRQVTDFASRARRGVLAGLAALALGGCATVPAPAPSASAAAPARHDPFERTNRGLFAFGRALDRALVRPIVEAYRAVLPRPVRHAVHNVVQNLDEPVVFANDLLQLHPAAAGRTAVRFAANSTVGVAGVFDAAATAGLPHHDNGFGSTLGRYGVGPGPYFYLPLLGPTTLRDAVGEGVDFGLDPFTWSRFGNAQTFDVARTGLSLLDERVEADKDLKTLEATAADPYATLRSVYFQSRRADIEGADAALDELPPLPEPAPSSAATP
jgi:phospholipid-binding lipoprotein MlaA